MSDKISESGWKAFVKSLKLDQELDDKELLKLLARVDKTDERKPEPRLEALKDLAKEIPKQVAAATKLKKQLGDKPFGQIKDQLYAMLDAAETAQKKAQTALDEADGEDDEDAKPDLLANPKLLYKQLNLCRQDPERTVNFAYVDGKDGQPALLAMHPRMNVKKLFAKLQEAAGVKAGSYGTAWVDGTSLMLQLEKPLSGLVKKIRQPVKACGFKIAKAVLWDADGTVFEQDEQAEDVVGVPTAPGSPSDAYARKLADLQPRVRQAAEAGSADREKHAKLLEFAAGKAKADDFLAALTALKHLQDLLDKPTPKAAPGEGGDPGSAFKSRLAVLIPKIKEAQTSQHPGAQAASLKAAEAGVMARKGLFAEAQGLLDELEDLLAGKAAPSAGEPKPGAESKPIDTWNALRKELQPLIDDAVKVSGERATKISAAWSLALECAAKGDFGRADLIAKKLKETLSTPAPKTTGQGEKTGDSKVDVTQALLQARGEIARIRAQLNSFGSTWPTLWGTRLEAAENAVESVSAGSLKEIQDSAAASDKILKELEPKIAELTGKKREFEQKARALEDRHKQLGTLNAVTQDTAMTKRHDKLSRDLQAARDLADDEFKYDQALVAVDEAMNKALQMDKEADAWDRLRAIYTAREALFDEALLAYNGLTAPVQELTNARDEIQTEWNKVHSEWKKTAYAEAIAASDKIPALVAALKRKALIFEQVGSWPPGLVTQLQSDRNKYGELFAKLYPQSLIDAIDPLAAPTYQLELDDKSYGQLKGIWDHMTAVRKRADDGLLYFQAAEVLTKASRKLLEAEASRRALRYVAPDYRDKVQDALGKGKTAANRQEFQKAKLAVDAGQRYADEQQTHVTRCLTYLTALDKTNAQLEKVQQQHSSESAKAATQACLMSVQEAETLALARDFDGAEKQLESVRTLLGEITAAEALTKSLGDAQNAPERTAGGEEMNKDIALIESAIKSAEDSSSKSGVNFEWNTLSNAKMSLAGMRRANRDGDTQTANAERQKALKDLSGLTDQLSSHKTSRALQTSLQTAIQASEALFGTLAANSLDVAKLLSTEFTDIKAEFAKKVTEPLAGKKQPAFDSILEALASLQNRLATWRAAAPQLAPFGTDAAQAEIVIAALETVDVPAVTSAYGGFEATFKTPLEKLPAEERHKALRQRKDALVKNVTIATLPKGAADMKAVIAEATAFKKETLELKDAVDHVGTKLNANVAAITDRVTQLGRQAAFDKLLKALEAAAQAGKASGLRAAANEIVHFDRMLQQLASSRTGFLSTYSGMNGRLTTAKSSLSSLAKSQSVDRAVTALLDQQATPIGAELERLKLAGEADANFYPAAAVDIAKVEPTLVQLEKDVAGLQPLAAPAEALEKQLKGLAAVSQIPAFKTAIERAEALSQAAAQAMLAVPPDFAKAKQDLDAAAKLATGATQASTGASATAPQAGSDGAPDYDESVKQLRTRHSQLASDSNRLALDPKGIEPLEKAVSDIEKLIAEAA